MMIISEWRNRVKCNKVYTVCYDTLDVFNTKKEASNFYRTCYYMSEGSEHERYASILIDLQENNIGMDNVSDSCNKISVKTKEGYENFIKIDLGEYIPIPDTIKFYEDIVNPILEISEEYEIKYNNKIPFEAFGSDIDYNMISFSEFYKEVLDKFNYKINTIKTDDLSDGKYNLVVNDTELKVCAWDKIEDVIENVQTLLTLSKHDDLEM